MAGNSHFLMRTSASEGTAGRRVKVILDVGAVSVSKGDSETEN